MDPISWQWVANFGFAAVVAMYVLVRLEPNFKQSIGEMSKRLDLTIRSFDRTVKLLTIVVAKQAGMTRKELDDLDRDFIDPSEGGHC